MNDYILSLTSRTHDDIKDRSSKIESMKFLYSTNLQVKAEGKKEREEEEEEQPGGWVEYSGISTGPVSIGSYSIHCSIGRAIEGTYLSRTTRSDRTTYPANAIYYVILESSIHIVRHRPTYACVIRPYFLLLRYDHVNKLKTVTASIGSYLSCSSITCYEDEAALYPNNTIRRTLWPFVVDLAG